MKAAIIAGILGLLFMVGGFFAGMQLAPKVPPPPPVHVATHAPAPTSPFDNQPKTSAITPEALRKTSDDLFALNQTLTSKKMELDAFERKLKERSEELKEERAALDRSHKKLSGLFATLQQRLDLVETKQMDQVQKQVDLFQSMDMPQAIDLMRAMDDPIVVRMFTLMDTKPLGKLMAAWKTKYPDDTKRLLSMLSDMGKVLPKDKIALAPGTDSIDPGPAVPADGSSAPAADGSTPIPPADASTTPADQSAPTAPAPAAAPASDTNSPSSSSNPPALASTDSNASTNNPPDASQTNGKPPMDPSWNSGSDKPAPDNAASNKKGVNPNSPD